VDEQDDPLEDVSKKEGIECYRGERDDVIKRLNEARIKYKLDYVFNMTADASLIPVEFVPLALEQFKRTNADLIHTFNMPAGLYISCLKPEAMQKVVDLKNDLNTEYWLHYFLKTNFFRVEPLEDASANIKGKENYRIGIDYPEDHAFLTRLYNEYGPSLIYASSAEIVKFLDEHPEIAKINMHCAELGKHRTESDPASHVSLKNLN
jgi:spore coat polysaccharide biosynthesis protein SpsF (cytidylyltransferase family)